MPELITQALFVHHSVGRYIIQQGRLREKLEVGQNSATLKIALWDHDYNKFGLSDPAGRRLGRAFPIPEDNTDPAGLVNLFDPAVGPDVDLRTFQLIITKSCYPNSAIKTEGAYVTLQNTYRRLVELLGDRLTSSFVVMTSPPLAPLRTTPEEAERARNLSQWLCELDRPKNVWVFDLFDLLADSSGSSHSGMLRREFRRLIPVDSHPNRKGCEAVASALSTFLLNTPGLITN